MAQWNGAPRCCSGPFSSAVTIWKQSFRSPFIPSNHVTHYCMRLPALELCMPRSPCDITQTQPNIHTQQMPRTNTGLMSTEPMLELKFLQQLLCRWIHLPKEGPLQDLSQNDVPWVLTYHIFQIWQWQQHVNSTTWTLLINRELIHSTEPLALLLRLHDFGFYSRFKSIAANN